MITAQTDGWATLKERVARRDCVEISILYGIPGDILCIAHRVDVFGDDATSTGCLGVIEFDHVKEDLGTSLKGADDEAHGVAVCSKHHRGSGWRSDTKEHRAAVRRYLAKLYPDVWT